MHYLYYKIITDNKDNIIHLISASCYNPLCDVMKRVIRYYYILYHVIYYDLFNAFNHV